MNNNQIITNSDLAQFYGSENFYFNPLFKSIKYTEGVKYISDRANWLITAILSHAIHTKKVAKEEFVVATLKVDLPNKKAVLTFDDGNDKVIATQVIEYTDFPLSEISFYLENRTLMLPSER